jgi:LmbE family N-acetylglucosaminyl deacetylase
MEQRCLLAAFAHPDDEAFGTAGVFRKYRDEGARTALVCATRGEEGQISDPALATPQTLGQVREQELREACRIIGVEDPLLFANLRAVEVPPTRQCPARKRMGKPIPSTPATDPRHPPRNSRRRRGRMYCPTPKRCPHVLMKALA